jgi:hypothetical protein
MADPLFQVQWRPRDSDNDLLRKILNVLNGTGGSDGSGGSFPISTVAAGFGAVATSAFTRPADTTAYANGDLVANSTTAGSVVPLTFANAVRDVAGVSRIERIRLRKSGTSITNASFRVHLFSASPTVTNGDNGAFLTPVSDYIGAFDVIMDRAFSNGAAGAGVPISGGAATFTIPAGTSLFALIEARAAYTPVSAEVFTCVAELYRF